MHIIYLTDKTFLFLIDNNQTGFHQLKVSHEFLWCDFHESYNDHRYFRHSGHQLKAQDFTLQYHKKTMNHKQTRS